MSSIHRLLLLRRRRDGPIQDVDVMRVAHLALRREGGGTAKGFQGCGKLCVDPICRPSTDQRYVRPGNMQPGLLLK
jgi:hypothetical protein